MHKNACEQLNWPHVWEPASTRNQHALARFSRIAVDLEFLCGWATLTAAKSVPAPRKLSASKFPTFPRSAPYCDTYIVRLQWNFMMQFIKKKRAKINQFHSIFFACIWKIVFRYGFMQTRLFCSLTSRAVINRVSRNCSWLIGKLKLRMLIAMHQCSCSDVRRDAGRFYRAVSGRKKLKIVRVCHNWIIREMVEFKG
jgi:hypothetical protein